MHGFTPASYMHMHAAYVFMQVNPTASTYSYTVCIKYSQAIKVLNHAGISVSYTTAWKYLHELIVQSNFQETIRSGRWQWVFDNVNLHQTTRHERQGKHSNIHDTQI